MENKTEVKFNELKNTSFMNYTAILDNPCKFADMIRTLSWNAICAGNNTSHYLADRGPLKLEFETVCVDEVSLQNKEIEFSFYNTKSITGYESTCLAELVCGLLESTDNFETVFCDVYTDGTSEELVIRLCYTGIN